MSPVRAATSNANRLELGGMAADRLIGPSIGTNPGLRHAAAGARMAPAWSKSDPTALESKVRPSVAPATTSPSSASQDTTTRVGRTARMVFRYFFSTSLPSAKILQRHAFPWRVFSRHVAWSTVEPSIAVVVSSTFVSAGPTGEHARKWTAYGSIRHAALARGAI